MIEDLEVQSLKLDELTPIATIQTGDFYSYSIVKSKKDSHPYTLRAMSKARLHDRGLGAAIVRERNFLSTQSYLFASLPIFFKIFQDPK